MPTLVQLNGVTSPIFTGIGRSPVPVLLPFDAAAFLEARLNGAPASLSFSRYQVDFRPVDLFDAGPAGYDAVFSLEPGAGGGMPQRTFARPVEVHITGSILVYDIDDPVGGKGEPVQALAAQFPDLRRFIREGYVRYAFTRFGVPYVVSIQCLDSAPRERRLACREAYPVAEALSQSPACRRRPAGAAAHGYSGGNRRAASGSRARLHLSPERRHHRQLGLAQASGHADSIAYSQIRFPLEKPIAFVHSQEFRARRSSDKPLDELSGGNTSYPWRDNFCEARSFNVGQCPSGFGHQGEDIRPAPCPLNVEGGDRCDPRQQAVVAVRDAVVIRAPKQQAVTLQINTRNEHARFRYMHMNPAALDASGMLNGPQRGRGREDRRGFELSRPPPTAPACICISTSRCSRATAGSGSIPTSP